MMSTDSPSRPWRDAASNERGVALLIVLVIVALLTILVTEFTYNVQLDQHRTRNAIHAMQAQLLARSGINLAEAFLMLDDDQTYDAKSEDWYLQLIQFCNGVQLDESTQLRCRVEDESGKLNINNTRGVQRRVASQSVTQDAILRDALRCMFTRRNIDVEIVDRLADYWEQEPQLKPDGTPQQVPDFTSLEDFGATFGIPGQQVRQLRNVVTALPSRWHQRINVNNAKSEVLAAVLTDNAPQDCGPNESVDAIVERQADPTNPFKNTAELSAVINTGNNATQKRTLFDVKSHVFRLEASAVTNMDPNNPQAGGIGQTLSTLVYRGIGTQAPAAGVQPQMGANGQPIPNWTLRPLDWQKEGGARLFRAAPSDDGQPGGADDQGEPGAAGPPNG